eukprot:551273_1
MVIIIQIISIIIQLIIHHNNNNNNVVNNTAITDPTVCTCGCAHGNNVDSVNYNDNNMTINNNLFPPQILNVNENITVYHPTSYQAPIGNINDDEAVSYEPVIDIDDIMSNNNIYNYGYNNEQDIGMEIDGTSPRPNGDLNGQRFTFPLETTTELNLGDIINMTPPPMMAPIMASNVTIFQNNACSFYPATASTEFMNAMSPLPIHCFMNNE